MGGSSKLQNAHWIIRIAFFKKLAHLSKATLFYRGACFAVHTSPKVRHLVPAGTIDVGHIEFAVFHAARSIALVAAGVQPVAYTIAGLPV
jgi:hypothetical protein